MRAWIHVLDAPGCYERVARAFCTSDRIKCVPMLFRGLCQLMDNIAWGTLKSRSKFELSKPAISRYVEHNALSSKGKYTRQYPYVIRLFRI